MDGPVLGSSTGLATAMAAVDEASRRLPGLAIIRIYPSRTRISSFLISHVMQAAKSARQRLSPIDLLPFFGTGVGVGAGRDSSLLHGVGHLLEPVARGGAHLVEEA